jgi:hypothetical protein
MEHTMSKVFSRRIFKINDELSILCESQDTRSGFRHVAIILRNGCNTGRKPVKICYLNRTWESYEFQSVLNKLGEVGDGLDDNERALIKAL